MIKMSKLTPAELQDFGAWAFSDRSGTQSMNDDVRMWNEKHGHLLHLEGVWHLCEVIERCLELWQEHRNDSDKLTDQNSISERQGALDGDISAK